jgi:hypothetical protein
MLSAAVRIQADHVENLLASLGHKMNSSSRGSVTGAGQSDRMLGKVASLLPLQHIVFKTAVTYRRRQAIPSSQKVQNLGTNVRLGNKRSCPDDQP